MYKDHNLKLLINGKKQDLQWNIIRNKQNYFEDQIMKLKNTI